jgi:peptide/nickel transport system permease protein
VTESVADGKPVVQAVSEDEHWSSSRQLLRATFHSPIAKLGGALLVGFVVLALVGAIWNPDANEISVDIRQDPSREHLFGTDHLGRDVLTRLIAGGYRIMGVSALAALTSIVLGAGLGAVVAYKGGKLDQVLMRILDVLLSFPVILVALLAAALLPSGYVSLYLVVVVLFVPPITRVTRSIFADHFSRDYVTVAALRGESVRSVAIREALPNAAPLLLVEFALRWNYAVILIASLNFLGVGVQPPTPDWGVMVYEARVGLLVAPWAAIIPALALAGLAVAINFAADGLANALAQRETNVRRI